MRFKIQTVKLSNIDCKDNTYRITTETNVSDLMVSIRHVGLLNPPLLIGDDTEYTVVSGFRRIEACRGLGWSHLEARLLDPETTMIDCAQYAITDNALQRPLNLIETSRSIGLISAFVQDDDTMAMKLSSLSLPQNPALVKKIQKIRHLSRPIQRAILFNTISLAMALELGDLAPDAGNGFIELFENLKLSLNKQREVVNLVKEIAFREEIAVMEVLREKRLQEILTHADLDKSQKTRMIRSYLKKRRFPAITSAERTFDRLMKELKLGSEIKLTPPDNFEGPIYTLTLKFKDLVELKDRQATFDTIIRNPALEKILGR